MIKTGKWYKHEDSTAFAKVVAVYKKSVRIVYDNGFSQMVGKGTFDTHFVVTPRSEKMDEEEAKHGHA